MSEEKRLLERIAEIRQVDEDAILEALARQKSLVKPPGSLGGLESISIRIAGITGKPMGNDMRQQAILVMAADNGVVEEGVSVAPQSVTCTQTINMTKGITGMSSMARYFDIDLLLVDLGIKLPVPKQYVTDRMLDDNGHLTDLIVNRRIGPGTANLAKGPAMSRQEAIHAISVGVEAVDAAVKAGKRLLGVGEMGIGNTTTAAALLGCLTGFSAEPITGRGGGLNDTDMAKKVQVINDAISRYKDVDDVIDKMAAVSGFDICGMTGAFLGAAMNRVPIVIDGFISMVAALAAKRIAPASTEYMFASHESFEKGYFTASERVGVSPMFNLGMRLGEGSGCPLAFKTIEAACASMDLMKTFAEASIDDSYLEEIREGNLF